MSVQAHNKAKQFAAIAGLANARRCLRRYRNNSLCVPILASFKESVSIL